jgi:hypothetical protein
VLAQLYNVLAEAVRTERFGKAIGPATTHESTTLKEGGFHVGYYYQTHSGGRLWTDACPRRRKAAVQLLALHSCGREPLILRLPLLG